MINEQKRDAVCLRVVLRAAWRGEGDCGKVRCNVYSELSSWSVIISCHCILDKHSMRICVCDLSREKTESRLHVYACVWVLTKQKETGQRLVSVCVWHVIWRWQMVLVTASAVANRLPRRHCSQGLFWWGGAPKGDHITTRSSPSHGSAKSPSFLLSLSRLFVSNMMYNKHFPLLFSQTHFCVPTGINTHILMLVHALLLTHIHAFVYVCEVASCA